MEYDVVLLLFRAARVFCSLFYQSALPSTPVACTYFSITYILLRSPYSVLRIKHGVDVDRTFEGLSSGETGYSVWEHCRMSGRLRR